MLAAALRASARVLAPRHIATLLLGLSAITVLAPSGGAQQAPKAGDDPASKPQNRPYTIAVVGASVSAGFALQIREGAFGEKDRGFRLAKVLDDVVPDKTAAGRPIAFIDAAFDYTFSDPYPNLTKQVAAATEEPVDLVIGVDFPFWLGYGPMKATEDQRRRLVNGEITVDQLRLEMGRDVLKMVDVMRRACTGPVLIGNYPDMSSADARLLPRSAIPDKETLAALNKQVADFAAERPDVVVLDLNGLLAGVRANGYELSVNRKRYKATMAQMFQWDLLHTNHIGSAVVMHEILGALQPKLPKDCPLRESRPTLAAMLDVTGGADYLEELEELKPVEAGK